MLIIPRRLQDEVIAHCRRDYPKEACGLLGGKSGRVASAYPMRNVDDSSIGYSMDPKEQLLVMKRMRQQGEDMVGVYHSHTASAAYPSSVDVSLAISPDISYVLVSLKDREKPDFKSYRIDGGAVAPEAAEIV